MDNKNNSINEVEGIDLTEVDELDTYDYVSSEMVVVYDKAISNRVQSQLVVDVFGNIGHLLFTTGDGADVLDSGNYININKVKTEFDSVAEPSLEAKLNHHIRNNDVGFYDTVVIESFSGNSAYLKIDGEVIAVELEIVDCAFVN